MDVKQAIDETFAQLPLPAQEIEVAFSGGLDSTVLMHALSQANQNQWLIRAIHVHHGLSPNADNWEKHCRQIATTCGIPLEIIHVNAKPLKGESPEAAARKARYQAFHCRIKPNQVLVLGHHAHDQAETLLLQLLRGSGVRGLAAMPVLTRFDEGWLVRPLLSISRFQLEAYARAHQLQWIEDESNANLDFDRNYLRHEILPRLTARWPGTISSLARTASHCAEAQDLLTELAQIDGGVALLPSDERHDSKQVAELDLAPLMSFSLPRLRNVLRQWISAQGFLLPSTVKLQAIIENVIKSAPDRMPCVSWEGTEIRRYRQILYVMKPLVPHDASWLAEWDIMQDLTLPSGLGVLRASEYRKLAKDEHLTIRFRQGGEVLKMPGREGHHTLKSQLQEWGIPPWLRSRLPLIFQRNQLVSVLGLDLKPFFWYKLTSLSACS